MYLLEVLSGLSDDKKHLISVSIISINKNNKVIYLYGQTWLFDGKNNSNAPPILVPTGGIYLPLPLLD